jgi:hypothetical protein
LASTCAVIFPPARARKSPPAGGPRPGRRPWSGSLPRRAHKPPASRPLGTIATHYARDHAASRPFPSGPRLWLFVYLGTCRGGSGAERGPSGGRAGAVRAAARSFPRSALACGPLSALFFLPIPRKRRAEEAEAEGRRAAQPIAATVFFCCAKKSSVDHLTEGRCCEHMFATTHEGRRFRGRQQPHKSGRQLNGSRFPSRRR